MEYSGGSGRSREDAMTCPRNWSNGRVSPPARVPQKCSLA